MLSYEMMGILNSEMKEKQFQHFTLYMSHDIIGMVSSKDCNLLLSTYTYNLH